MPRLQKTYLGIDPGKSGGLAWFLPDGIAWLPMPKTERDIWEAIDEKTVSVAVIEKVHSMPKQGVTSSFTFGMGYGGLRMALIAAGIPFDEVHPRQWQKTIGVPPRRKGMSQNEWKDVLRQKAQQLFPNLGLWEESKGVQLAVCDALLLAEYCRRLNP